SIKFVARISCGFRNKPALNFAERVRNDKKADCFGLAGLAMTSIKHQTSTIDFVPPTSASPTAPATNSSAHFHNITSPPAKNTQAQIMFIILFNR
ncbi:MAG: hypothetical protein ACETVZ_03960, partial [Phycisphaerae bacterium]